MVKDKEHMVEDGETVEAACESKHVTEVFVEGFPVVDIGETGAEEAQSVEVHEVCDEIEEVFLHCICSQGVMARCPHCPFYLLEAAVEEHLLLPGETATLPATISGAYHTISTARTLPYPTDPSLPYHSSLPCFDLLRRLGRCCLVARVVHVLTDQRLIVTFKNGMTSPAVVRRGDVLGICQKDNDEEVKEEENEKGEEEKGED